MCKNSTQLKRGKFLCFGIDLGPPGAGKSTSAALLGRDHGYVYYEGDCIFTWSNPYINPRSEEPTMEDYNQVPLKVNESSITWYFHTLFSK